MFILKDVDFSKLIYRNLSSKHILIIEYISLDGKKIRKSFKNDGKYIHVEGIKELTKARVGHDQAWKNVLDLVKKKMLVEGKVGLSNNIVSLDNVYFLYGSKFLNPKNKLDYITKNINIKNIIPFKCKKIEEVIDEKIKRIMNTSDLELLDNYNGDFKLEVNREVTKYYNKSNKRINSKYQYGHINSFINIIQDAKNRNLKELIIFEDDVLFHNYIKNLLLNFSNIKKNADIIYFGASKHNGYHVDNSEYKCKNVTGTFAVFIKNNVFDDYLELLNLNLLPSDVCLAILLQKYKTYVYEPNVVIADLNYSSIRERNNIKETYKKFNWNLNNYKNYENKHILVVLPTFNRSENIKNIINMINKQSYKYYDLLIIDDGSNISHKTKINQIKKQNKNNSNIIFKENNKNLNIANTLNKGIQFFKDNNNKYSFFTWISDDNIYHEDFLEKLITDNSYFKYSSFNLVNIIKNTTKKVNVKYNIDNLLNNFKGCASFMWTKEAILNIGFYNSTINGCEDLEYLIRTFKTGKVKDDYEEASLMDYIRHTDSLYVKDNENIIKLKNNILKICKFLNNNNANLLYYSKTNYNILFQRPQQIMRFYDKTYNKVFIGNIENVELDEKYGLLVVPYSLKDCVFNFINNNKKYLYFTDSRLYNEITDKTEYIKIYDLIDAPIEEFKVWKPNLELCVKNSNHVMYSHPKLINYLREIDNTKEYTYISNACDYKHFSKAKNRIGKRPPDFPLTNKPILGYYGSFAEWLDFDIIRKYADEENYHIVMIGGIPNNKNYNLKFQHANITWLDHKPYNELPYYLSWFDKCFLPFKDCKLTKFVNPCKLWEYMASEKEIIKYNINMEVDNLITYDEVCDKMKNVLIKKKVNLSIVLLCFNKLEYTKMCINSVLKNTYNQNYELIIVNNGSTDETCEYLNKIKSNNVRIINNELNLGFSKGMNIGAKNCHGEYLILLNNDTIVGEGWDVELIKTLENDKNIFAVTPLTNFSGNETKIDLIHNSPNDFFKKVNEIQKNLFINYFEVKSLALFCACFRKKDFVNIKYLDENYLNGWEDDDLYKKIEELNKSVAICTKSTVYHFGSITVGKNFFKNPNNSNRLFYEKKWNVKWKTSYVENKNLVKNLKILHDIELPQINFNEDKEYLKCYTKNIFENIKSEFYPIQDNKEVIIILRITSRTERYNTLFEYHKTLLTYNNHSNIKNIFVYYDSMQVEDIKLKSPYEIVLKGEECYIPGIYVKTYKAIKYLNKIYNIKYLVRTNLSTIINYKKLLDLFNIYDKKYKNTVLYTGTISCNRDITIDTTINTKLVSGLGIIFNKKAITLFINNGSKYLKCKVIDDLIIAYMFYKNKVNAKDNLFKKINLKENWFQCKTNTKCISDIYDDNLFIRTRIYDNCNINDLMKSDTINTITNVSKYSHINELNLYEKYINYLKKFSIVKKCLVTQKIGNNKYYNNNNNHDNSFFRDNFIDCYLLINDKSKLKEYNKKWNIILLENNLLPIHSKIIKFFPLKYFWYFKSYQQMLYLDDKYELKPNLNFFNLDNKYMMKVTKHALNYKNVFQEFEQSLIHQNRYRKEYEILRKSIEEHIFLNYKTINKTHYQTGLILYNLQHEKFPIFQKICHDKIIKTGNQCQIMFWFVSQMFSKEITAFSQNFYEMIKQL